MKPHFNRRQSIKNDTQDQCRLRVQPKSIQKAVATLAMPEAKAAGGCRSWEVLLLLSGRRRRFARKKRYVSFLASCFKNCPGNNDQEEDSVHFSVFGGGWGDPTASGAASALAGRIFSWLGLYRFSTSRKK